MNKVLTAEEILRKHIQEFKHPVELAAVYDEDYAGGKYLCINESVVLAAMEAYKNQSSVSDEEDLEPSKETKEILDLADSVQKSIHEEIEATKKAKPQLAYQDVFNTCVIFRLAKHDYIISQLQKISSLINQ